MTFLIEAKQKAQNVYAHARTHILIYVRVGSVAVVIGDFIIMIFEWYHFVCVCVRFVYVSDRCIQIVM